MRTTVSTATVTPRSPSSPSFGFLLLFLLLMVMVTTAATTTLKTAFKATVWVNVISVEVQEVISQRNAKRRPVGAVRMIAALIPQPQTVSERLQKGR